MSVHRGWFGALLLIPLLWAGLWAAPVPAQTANPGILLVDRERVLRDSDPAQILQQQERAARVQRRNELDQLRAELETEEAAIAAIRDSGDNDAFEARVRLFDQRVRAARQDSQKAWEALELRFRNARQNIAVALEPVFQEIMAERGASLIVDARTVLAARAGADITDEVIRRFNARVEAAPLLVLPPATNE